MPVRKLIIDACGPDFARRFFLKDGDGNFWSEKNQAWTSEFAEAGLWTDWGDVGRKMHDLMLSEVQGEIQHFVAPVVVEVKADEPVDLVALEEWLRKAVQFYMNAEHGVGPGEAMVMLKIEWEDLKESEDESV